MDKILLVDDDIVFNETLKEWLELQGHEILAASNGKEALQILEHTTPTLSSPMSSCP